MSKQAIVHLCMINNKVAEQFAQFVFFIFKHFFLISSSSLKWSHVFFKEGEGGEASGEAGHFS